MPEKKEKPLETDGFLGSLDAKIAALQTLRASYVAAVSIGAFGQPGEGGSISFPMGAGVVGVSGAPMELPHGALLGKSLPAAIRLYLSAIKRKQTIKEIATALREGGVESTAANFETSISSAVNRLKASGEVLRFKDGWALAEFYPDSLRAKIGAATEAKPRKKGRKAAKRTGTKKAAEPEPSSKTQILATFLAKHPGVSYTSSELAAAAGVASVGLGIVLMHLQKAGKVRKDGDGRYRAA